MGAVACGVVEGVGDKTDVPEPPGGTKNAFHELLGPGFKPAESRFCCLCPGVLAFPGLPPLVGAGGGVFAPDAGRAGVVGTPVSLALAGVVAGVWRKSPPKSFFMAGVYLDMGPSSSWGARE